MGSWGPEPWDSDGASDWFAELFAHSDIEQRVLRTLALDPEDRFEEMRAACYVVMTLGRTYIWPGERLGAVLAATRRALIALLESSYAEDSPQLSARLREDLSVVERRIRPSER